MFGPFRSPARAGSVARRGDSATSAGAARAGVERVLVLAIAAHSYGVGFALMFATEWGARLGGFGPVAPLFFPRQAGAFHLVVATGYLLEYFRYRGVSLLLVTKAIAVVFLLSMTVAEPVPWVVPVSAVADGLMGTAVALVRRTGAVRPVP